MWGHHRLPYAGDHVRLLAWGSDQASVGEVTVEFAPVYDDRPEWGWDLPTVVTADVSSGIATRIVEPPTAPDDFERVWELKGLKVVAESVSMGEVVEALAARRSRGQLFAEYDLGFRRVALEEVSGLVGYEPVHLGLEGPGGLRLVDVAYAPESTLVGVASNPPSVEVVVFTYRAGLHKVIITNRLASATIEGVGSEGIPDRVPTAEDWADPFVYGPLGEVTVGDPIGPMSPLIGAAYGQPVHSWGVIGDAVVTVEGNIHPQLLQDVVRLLVGK